MVNVNRIKKYFQVFHWPDSDKELFENLHLDNKDEDISEKFINEIHFMIKDCQFWKNQDPLKNWNIFKNQEN